MGNMGKNIRKKNMGQPKFPTIHLAIYLIKPHLLLQVCTAPQCPCRSKSAWHPWLGHCNSKTSRRKECRSYPSHLWKKRQQVVTLQSDMNHEASWLVEKLVMLRNTWLMEIISRKVTGYVIPYVYIYISYIYIYILPKTNIAPGSLPKK